MFHWPSQFSFFSQVCYSVLVEEMTMAVAVAAMFLLHFWRLFILVLIADALLLIDCLQLLDCVEVLVL